MDSPLTTTAVLTHCDIRTDNVHILTLAPALPFLYEGGQYIRASLAGLEPRAYSLATAPKTSGLLQLHVRNTNTGTSAELCALKPGDMVTIEGPFGTMKAAPAHSRPVVMIGGGTGVAPLLALAQTIIRDNITDAGITLIYGVKSENGYYCKPEIEALCATGEVTAHILTNPDTPDKALKQLGLNLAHSVSYLSGPKAMIDAVRPILIDHLADPARIFSDYEGAFS